MVKSNLLKAKMTEKGYTQKSLASAIGISAASLNYKINNIREFKVSEMRKICDLLEIGPQEAYFFYS